MSNYNCKIVIILILVLIGIKQPAQSQNYEAESVVYNTLIGAFSGGIGAVINKNNNEDSKWYKRFEKGFIVGSFGGFVEYEGKKINFYVGSKNELGYAWASRAVFSAGNSIVENAAENKEFWSIWHFDIGFVRLEYDTKTGKMFPRLMPSSFAGFMYLTSSSNFDLNKTIRSGTPVFYSPLINNDSSLAGYTSGNCFVLRSALNKRYYSTFGHEMIHTFQFQEISGVNYFFDPISENWKKKSSVYKKISKWVYFDLNYEAMLFNYFIVQGGSDGKNYRHNFLENEAEFLSTGFSIYQ